RAARRRGEAVAAGKISLVRLTPRRQRDRREARAGAADNVDVVLVVDEIGAVIAAGKLALVAAIADARLVELRTVVDRIDEEVAAGAAEQPPPGVLFACGADAHVPARVHPFVDAGVKGLALGLELERRRGRRPV